MVVAVPLGQYEQYVRPGELLNVPTGHPAHIVAPAALYVPALHGMQLEEEFAPVVLLYVPAPHGVQVEAPVVVLYVPWAHGVQTDEPSGLYVPTGHIIGLLPPAVGQE